MNKNINQDDYSRRSKSFLPGLFAKIRSPFLGSYALIRKSPIFWSYLNKTSISLFKSNTPKLNESQISILNNLRKNGIAFTHIDELFNDPFNLNSILDYSKKLKINHKLSNQKSFLDYYLGKGSPLDLNNPLIQLSINENTLNIVNSYLGLCSKLVYFELASSKVIGKNDITQGSQRWHRDPGLSRICKMFIYLTDVDENSGPFTYVKKSHNGGDYNKVFPQKQFGRHGYYPQDGLVEKEIPNEKLIKCVGKAGTVIFCDTIGLHKGGHSISNSRTMYTSSYMSQGEIIKKRYVHSEDFINDYKSLNDVAKFAIN
tara:strand:- start:3292 stop:4236 length:945 start_codon:yes stop_codon:yes gene_type:complete